VLAETVVQDYDALGFSLHPHPMQLVREALDIRTDGRDRPPVCTCAEVKSQRRGRRVAVAGLVTVRQRPGTAKGVVFMTLEDETGMANLIIRAEVWERCWLVARNRVALIAEGVIERQGQVVHVMVRHLRDLPTAIAPLRHESRDFH
jgi:error-prone DNA polymerase